MKIDKISQDYPSLKKVVERIKKEDGIKELYPPQAKAYKTNYLEGKNLILATRTSSGKTIMAELAGLKKILEDGKKFVYLVPLKSLASEKFQKFKSKYSGFAKIAISVGDLDSKDSWLQNYDLIISSYEKFDSLLRHNPSWLEDVGLVVVDEIHMLNDESRGPTLEILITRLKKNLNPQILGLSATIKNSKEIAEWLNGKLVESDFRPVKLYQGIFNGNKVSFRENDRDFNLEGDSYSLAENTVKDGKQGLMFVSTRRYAESAARKAGEKVKTHLSKGEKEKLEELSEKVKNVLSTPTQQCKKLAKVVKKGVAFEHAGLATKQKNLIENAYRDRLLKIIACTPVLSYGMSLPTYRVIIRDSKRYYGGYSDYIPILEYYQMIGRAGRPEYEGIGESILVSKGNKEELVNRFILGEPEEIYSKLGVEPILRMHTLSLISSYITPSEKKLNEFISHSFFSFQYEDLSKIMDKMERILERLEEYRFIERSNGKLKPTRIGKRVAELYLDPDTAHNLIEAIETEKEGNLFAYLTLISHSREMRPVRMKKREFDLIQEEIAKREETFLLPPPSPWDLEYDNFLNSIKTALVLKEWCEEKGENYLLDRFGVTPGGLRSRIEIADWMLYSSRELASLLGRKEKIREIRKVRLRVKNGVKKELLPLIRLKGIGRVRARKLYKKGIKSVSSLKKIPLKRLQSILGRKVGKKIKEQLSDKKDKQEILR